MSKGHGLPNGWARAKLREITLTSGTRNPKKEGGGDTFSYVDIDALDNVHQKIVSPKVLAKSDAPSRARMAIRAGDVIFSLVRPYLKNIAIVPPELDGEVASTAYCVLRPTECATSAFLFYQVIQEAFIHSVSTYGNSPPSARDEEFLDMVVCLAPLNEQRRIVAKIEELFSDLDAGVAALERVRANLKRYRAAVLKAAVEGRLTAAWRAKNPPKETGPQLLARILRERRRKWEEEQLAAFARAGKTPPAKWKEKYKEPAGPDYTSLRPLPEGWCWATIEQVSEYARYGSSAKAFPEPLGVPVLRMGNIQDGSLDVRSLKYLPVGHAEFPDLLLQPGDLLFNRTNSAELVGKSAVYRGEPSPCSYASYLISVRFLPGCESRCVCYFINSAHGRTWIASVVSQQVGQANVNGTKLQRLAIPLPPIDEQSTIIAEVEQRLSVLEEAEAQVVANVTRSARLRQAILQRAFDGKLVPQDPHDESASALLARISAQPKDGRGQLEEPGRSRASRKRSQARGAASCRKSS